jgi:tRNA pseudouridine13 synthase
LPTGLQHQSGPDDCNAGRQKLTLTFELPRGSYATLIVKRMTSAE